MKQPLKILCALFFGSNILIGCIENHDTDYIYLPEYPGHTSDTTGQNLNKVAVSFSAAVSPIATKSGSSPLQAERNVNIYSFYFMDDYISTTSYASTSPGVLTPTRNVPLSLFPGQYEFYAVAIGNVNTKLPSVDLSDGFLENLSNGIDYLTCQLSSVTISGQTMIPLVFNHECSQLMVTIVANSTTTVIDSIASATVQQPLTNNAFIDIFSGGVSASSTLASAPIAMNIVDSLCNQILLPIKNIDSLAMNFSVYANGQLTPQPYSVKIPLVNSAMLKGTSYAYQINIVEEQVVISTATVNNWTEVNETGNPLKPTPN